MKKKAILSIVAVLLFACPGCGVDSDGDGEPDVTDLCPIDPNKTDPGECGCGVTEGSCDNPANQKPSVRFLQPTHGSQVDKNLGVIVEASDPDGSVVAVDLHLDNTLVRTEGAAPYEWGTANADQNDKALLNLSQGDHQLRATATDNQSESQSVTITITVKASDPNSDSLTFPIRGAFYYSWYPQTWTVGGQHVFYDVVLGYYDSSDQSVVDQHIKDMDYGKIDLAIASWWGIDGHKENIRIPLLLNRTQALGSPLKWAMYFEKEGFGDPSVATIKTQLQYVMDNYTSHPAYARIDGKPVIFVYNADDGDCEVADRWKQAASNDWYLVLKVFGGYRNCNNQPDSWHQYGATADGDRQQGYSFMICPGFWRADQATPLVARNPDRWYQNVRDMVASGEPFQLIVSFNEWGEGTALEPAHDWMSNSGYGIYLDALHTDGVK